MADDIAHEKRLETGIAPFRWSFLQRGVTVRGPADLAPLATHKSWFDELFSGGIVLPTEVNRALTLLITGPPGTGKSTLATEICVRLARNRFSKLTRKSALYLSSEAYPPWLIRNVESFGWTSPEHPVRFDTGAENPAADIYVRTLDDINRYRRDDHNMLGVLHRLFYGDDDAAAPIAGPAAPEHLSNVGLVVIDSLNSVNHDRAQEFERHRNGFVSSGPQLIIMILDSPLLPEAEPWEFASDIVIRLDKEYRSGSNYMVRTFEILKARYQEHVWGRHQLKIYGMPKEEMKADPPHPFSVEGGIFVFPSLHFILSRFKSHTIVTSDEMPKPVATQLAGINDLLGGGLPSGKTTALIGGRGAHKSHLGLLQALKNLQESGRSLIISLRDDDQFTMQTLADQCKVHWDESKPTEKIQGYINEGALEIIHFIPGYITPEEFFHRILLSLYRMKRIMTACFCYSTVWISWRRDSLFVPKKRCSSLRCYRCSSHWA